LAVSRWCYRFKISSSRWWSS